MAYNRQKAIEYAHRWAYDRNPRYANFDNMGGDCTNFISQCLYAGGCAMNFTPTFGWYFQSLRSRSPSWSGVEFLHTFLTTNRGPGPYGHDAAFEELEPGDLIQISFDGVHYGHCVLIVDVGPHLLPSDLRIAAHTFNSDNRAITTYICDHWRYLHIDGTR